MPVSPSRETYRRRPSGSGVARVLPERMRALVLEIWASAAPHASVAGRHGESEGARIPEHRITRANSWRPGRRGTAGPTDAAAQTVKQRCPGAAVRRGLRARPPACPRRRQPAQQEAHRLRRRRWLRHRRRRRRGPCRSAASADLLEHGAGHKRVADPASPTLPALAVADPIAIEQVQMREDIHRAGPSHKLGPRPPCPERGAARRSCHRARPSANYIGHLHGSEDAPSGCRGEDRCGWRSVVLRP